MEWWVDQEGDLDFFINTELGHPNVASFQEFFQEELDDRAKVFHGRSIKVDNEWGPVTAGLAVTPRACGCPDRLVSEPARWPDACAGEITTNYRMSLTGVSDEEIEARWLAMLKSWNDLLEINLVLDRRPNPRIFATGGPLPGSTLAWSHLATNDCAARLEQRYDTTQRWNGQLLQAVAAHEVGHALGSGHLGDRSALMYPYVNASNYTPKPADVKAMLRLGYKERTTPPIDPPAPSGRTIILSSDMKAGTYTISDGGDNPTPWW